jgi:hypothetical protein
MIILFYLLSALFINLILFLLLIYFCMFTSLPSSLTIYSQAKNRVTPGKPSQWGLPMSRTDREHSNSSFRSDNTGSYRHSLVNTESTPTPSATLPLWILPCPLWILPSTHHLHALLWTTAALAPRQAASARPWIGLYTFPPTSLTTDDLCALSLWLFRLSTTLCPQI